VAAVLCWASSAGGPAAAHSLGKIRIGQALGARRRQLGNDAIAVGDEDGLAASGETHIFAELVLEGFQADSAHSLK
jgi:hypothetical protein